MTTVPRPVRTWQPPPPGVISCREWDGEFVVHDARTGSTHLLTASCGTILARLLDSPVGLTTSKLADDLGARGDDAAPRCREIEEILLELERLRLVEGARP